MFHRNQIYCESKDVFEIRQTLRIDITKSNHKKINYKIEILKYKKKFVFKKRTWIK